VERFEKIAAQPIKTRQLIKLKEGAGVTAQSLP